MAWKATRIINKHNFAYVASRVAATKMLNANVDDYIGLITDPNYVKPIEVKPEVPTDKMEEEPKQKETLTEFAGPVAPPAANGVMEGPVKPEPKEKPEPVKVQMPAKNEILQG